MFGISLKREETQKIEERIAERVAALAIQESQLEELIAIVTHTRAEITMLRTLAANNKLDIATEVNYRTPKEMLKSEFKGMNLANIVTAVLGKSADPLTTTELCRAIYDPMSTDEFDRARNSLATELRTGAKGENPKWRKTGRYAYSAL